MSLHHKARRFDFAETRAGQSRKIARRLARTLKEQWLSDALFARVDA